MKRAACLAVAASVLVLAGCSGESGPTGADSMESELQKASQGAPQGEAWKPKSGAGEKFDKDKMKTEPKAGS